MLMGKITLKDLQDACSIVTSSAAVERRGDRVIITMESESPYILVGKERRYVREVC